MYHISMYYSIDNLSKIDICIDCESVTPAYVMKFS